MELQLRKLINKSTAHKVDDGFRKKVMDSIISNEDMQFHWSIVATDWEEDEAVVY